MFSRSSLPGLALRGKGKISDGSTLKILAADSLSGGVWLKRRTRSIFECIRCFLSADFSKAAPFHMQSLINISLRSPAWKYSEHSSSIESPSSAIPWQTGCSLASSVMAYGGELAGEIGGVGGNEKFFQRSSAVSLLLVFKSAESSLKSLKSEGCSGSKSLLKLSSRRLLTDKAISFTHCNGVKLQLVFSHDSWVRVIECVIKTIFSIKINGKQGPHQYPALTSFKITLAPNNFCVRSL